MATNDEVTAAFTALEEGQDHPLLEALGLWISNYVPPRDESRESYLNRELDKTAALWRWSVRRQVPTVQLDPPVCTHGVKLAGECSECAAESIKEGL